MLLALPAVAGFVGPAWELSQWAGLAAAIACVERGAAIVRVHDVPEQRDVVHVTDAIVRGWRPDGWTDALR